MDECRHIEHLQLAHSHSIFNPQKWFCVDCSTTQSLWACLSCSHVACGRYIAEHALKHFQESSHPVAFEVNDMYVFCYLCNDYVLNDTAAGDLKSLRSTLSAIKSRNYPCAVQRSRVLPPVDTRDDSSSLHDGAQSQPGNEGGMCAALWPRTLMGKIFRTWFERSAIGRKRQEQIQEKMVAKREVKKRPQELEPQVKAELENTPPRKSLRLQALAPPPAPAVPAKEKALSPTSDNGKLRKVRDSLIRRRPVVTPGVTGLRNLGNTCYMNSILQVLSHLLIFRQCFLKLDLNQWLAVAASDKSCCKHSSVTAAVAQQKHEGQEKEKGFACSRHPSFSSVLSGGSSKSRNMELIQPREPSSPYSSLCHELHTLFQVMWSGEWALVSPFAMLHSVWKLIPAFRGYAQQDAQEFLCELLDKIQRELETTGARFPALIPTSQRKLIEQVLNVVNNIFHGRLLSQVTCLVCDTKSNTIEPFWDLSLEFPERYQCSGKDAATSQPCLVTDMLGKFTETEALGGKTYMCDHCNSQHRKFSSKPVVLTAAQKQLMICHLPQVLRLHLKRFRWSGRNNREKIGVHVVFEEILNMEPYCCRESLKALRPECFIYTLSAVVIHHGKGSGSGHYTAYCYNSEGGFWVHCNDSKLSMCTMDEVRKAQAYILFYTQQVIENGHSKLLPPELLSSSQYHSEETDASSNEVLS
ncbi:ubiquitin carboxyl-terminal hydrolase 44 isoform X2 [Microtus ochrogaster]|uniref:Ubiquitin carboxyl-terminal hydrolase n=1 Tax=Microtus ochrogaster TaxID=79684 RepID=A0ABM1UEF2_MICOH|nr:ubiquitin carboxyl-terminal hydrolase 44 isoform X2 [Microtus ochrogaster]